ncbi:two-component system phosphate regulon sensor histidine kinase PhoR [Pedobacter cryoconitis]|uniref:histidine kinase n=1 Tax=Pedobacter cryoconitis TaxID=188932 RepID=A0A7W8ZKI1_9SPHI|nr:ATP-binding protein [Pedobacter cryoconitis]MBB5635701.1 two-component system phosphate regulon sensor histidine kinase PhoR [Pedobacter cryoconitis]MBB6273425.1 two-component system phosphate regulon sensor histidine kinase PhoR [Pedobacter cryoconitis]
MKLSVLVLITALAVGLSIGLVNFHFQQSWYFMLVSFAVSFVTSFIMFYYLLEKYIYSKIKLIYKLIHNLKLGKDLKDALGEYVSTDPINDVEHEVKEWAGAKKQEIDLLKKQEQFRREFLSNVSHEFKTPLFAIQGYIETLQDCLLDDPEMAVKFLKKAEKNVERLSYLINDLDAISKLESGEVPIDYRKFDFVLLAKEVMEALEDKAGKRKVHLAFKEKYMHPAFVNADREKIRQVMINLISNSIKYGKENGSTAIKIFELHDQYLIEVTDDGIGIDEKHLPRLFERFYRIDSHRSREVGGTGLGLAIVKHILEAHQQIISVRSTLQIGTTFAFTLQKVG